MLTGQAKTDYQREYMKRRRSNKIGLTKERSNARATVEARLKARVEGLTGEGSNSGSNKPNEATLPTVPTEVDAFGPVLHDLTDSIQDSMAQPRAGSVIPKPLTLANLDAAIDQIRAYGKDLGIQGDVRHFNPQPKPVKGKSRRMS